MGSGRIEGDLGLYGLQILATAGMNGWLLATRCSDQTWTFEVSLARPWGLR